jgi:hypothetical protein
MRVVCQSHENFTLALVASNVLPFRSLNIRFGSSGGMRESDVDGEKSGVAWCA